jgi:putative tryptophan/tyrosine transport system substrate-binding protein
MRKRRELLTALGLCALAAPLGAFAQQQGKVWRVGFLSAVQRPALIDSSPIGAILRAMRDLGYAEGKNLVVELRFADGQNERLPDLAAELVRLNVDAIVTPGTPATSAAQKATTTVPIVMVGVADPIGSGFVKSLSQPGGNITGFCDLTGETGPKLLDMLLGIVPKLGTVAVLVNPANPATSAMLKTVQTTARTLNIKILPVEARTSEEIERAFSIMTREHAVAVIVLPDLFFYDTRQRGQIAALAIQGRLPSISTFRDSAMAGALLSYGPILSEELPRTALYVVKILKGANPGDLPVEQSTKFELVINLKTAKALGITIPQSVLLRADEVIK